MKNKFDNTEDCNEIPTLSLDSFDTEPEEKSEGSETEEKREFGLERKYDLPWSKTKVAIFKAMITVGATSLSSARKAKEIVPYVKGIKTVNDMKIRHWSYHAQAAGLVKVCRIPGEVQYRFFITKKGVSELNKYLKSIGES